MAEVKESGNGRIISEFVSGELRIRISNAKRFNAMSLKMWEELERTVTSANERDDVRVVVLSGEGNKAFASGADISEFSERRTDPEQSARFNTALRSAQEALSQCVHPTVAVVRGVCMGGGMGLAMACDLRYCTNRSRFRMPAGRLGLGYELDGIKRWVNVLGAARTAELFFTARLFDGVEAARLGFVNESFDEENADFLMAKRVDAIKGLAPLTLRAAKLALRHTSNESSVPDREIVEQAIRDCFASEDYREGQQAFLGKREPRFTGR